MDKNKIKEAFDNHGSDKSYRHYYETAYAEILPDNVDNFLEVGIANYTSESSSVHSWHELYPNATIYAIDIVAEKMINNEFTKSFVVDQSDALQLNNFVDSVGAKFDIIIDDGSHVFDHAVLTFQFLFKLLNKDGIYIIEDVEKNKDSVHQQNVYEWENYFNENNIKYQKFDTNPDVNDDSIIYSIVKVSD
jgi:hypothetical protein